MSAQGSMLDIDLSREVYCILGVPIDAVGIQAALRKIKIAAGGKTPMFISTPNLNFLINAQSDPDFRESLLLSDLCVADGMPVVWIAQLIGVPIKDRVAGSDIFDALKAEANSDKPLKVFFFGGAESVAAAACQALNAERVGMQCVGSFDPGFCPVDEMSRDEIIDTINASGADFLVASLGAKKGQLWLQRNRNRLAIPVRAHLGAVVNFQAATVKRAPRIVRGLALEWLWRIKEEPHLWSRYWSDGRTFLRLLGTRVLPLVVLTWRLRRASGRDAADLVITQKDGRESVTIGLSGSAVARHIDKVIAVLSDAIAAKKQITIDLSQTDAVDARFLGLLLMLEKKFKGDSTRPIYLGLSATLKRIFCLHGLGYLLTSGAG